MNSDRRPDEITPPSDPAAPAADTDQLAFASLDATGPGLAGSGSTVPGSTGPGAAGPGATKRGAKGEAPPPTGDEQAGEAAAIGQLDLVLGVPVWLTVELGRTEIPIRDVVNLGRGSMIELDRGPGAPLDVRVNGVLIGRGEIVLINEERLGLRFLEVVSPTERVKRPD
ncbi:MAG TPA: flagellar motor switch protein FliN [Stellaceae bacterium]|jgi:flagellar motor switch protein FliN/FliY|nr:flagellar motor switch protein FliN [Stellaceae bacterium]